MRIDRSTVCLLTVFCTLTGCSQTGGVRPGGSSEMKTVASVGDKPLPIVSGEPGASLRAETEELDLPETAGTRISGRVYDGRGKPVANARVRLADNSSPGGKVAYATTDRSGAFTLRGLRAGSSYAVIAEYQGDDGMMTGRAEAKAPQTAVRIGLQPRDGASDQGHASIRPARPRIEPISNVDPADDESSDENRPTGKINAEDIEAPADDAASLPSRGNVRLSRASDDASRSTVRAGWNARQPSGAHVAGATTRSQETGMPPRRRPLDHPDRRPSRLQSSTTTAPIPCRPRLIPPGPVWSRRPSWPTKRPSRWPERQKDRQAVWAAERRRARSSRMTRRQSGSWKGRASVSHGLCSKISCRARG